MNKKTTAAYSRDFYGDFLSGTTTWQGVHTIKSPIDLWVYAEIIHETRPGYIIETGTFRGGSALYLAHLCDINNRGRVVSVDVNDGDFPQHPRISYIRGSSTDPCVVEHLRRDAAGERVMVILDSDHTKEHVLKELRMYAPLVSNGCYLIAEDTNPDGYKLALGGLAGGGPAEAVKAFQPSNHGFEVDRSRERFGFSQNPGGYLRRAR